MDTSLAPLLSPFQRREDDMLVNELKEILILSLLFFERNWSVRSMRMALPEERRTKNIKHLRTKKFLEMF